MPAAEACASFSLLRIILFLVLMISQIQSVAHGNIDPLENMVQSMDDDRLSHRLFRVPIEYLLRTVRFSV